MSLEELVNNMKNTGRENLLEEVGRLDARKNPNSNDMAEKRRVMSEIKDGYKKGGKVKKKRGCGMAKRGFGRVKRRKPIIRKLWSDNKYRQHSQQIVKRQKKSQTIN